MAVIKLSKEAAIKVKKITEETYQDMCSNNKWLNDRVYQYLLNLNDKPSTRKYEEMMAAIESLMSQLRNNFNDVSEYCDAIIKWIDEYNAH